MPVDVQWKRELCTQSCCKQATLAYAEHDPQTDRPESRDGDSICKRRCQYAVFLYYFPRVGNTTVNRAPPPGRF